MAFSKSTLVAVASIIVIGAGVATFNNFSSKSTDQSLQPIGKQVVITTTTPTGKTGPSTVSVNRIVSGKVSFIPTVGYVPKVGETVVSFVGTNGSPNVSTTTDVDGNYSVVLNDGWTGNIVSQNPSVLFYPTNSPISAISDLTNQNINMWKPPIGIPMPPFGITNTAPTRPSPWTTAIPGYYYIDQFGIGAIDNNNIYGYPGHARLTIPNTIPAGSVVEIHGSNQYYSDEQFITCNGTATQPVYIRGQDASQKGFIKFRMRISGSYTIIENLEYGDKDGDLTSGVSGKMTFLDNSNHVVFRNNNMHGNLGEGGIGVGGQYHVIWNNLIYDIGNWQANFDQDCHGMTVGDGVNHLWAMDNHIYRTSGDGMQVNGNTVDLVGLIYYGRNHAHNNKQSGFGCKKAHDIIISQNYMHDHTTSDSSPGLDTGYQYGPKNIWYIFNIMSNSNEAVQCAASNGENQDGQYFVGNVLYNFHPPAGYTYDANDTYHLGQCWDMWGYGTKFFVNNTIFDTDGGIGWDGDQTLSISNNIFANMKQGTHVLNIESLSSSVNSSFRNNLIQGWFSVRVAGSSTHPVYLTIAQLQTLSNKGQGCLNLSADFIDPINFNFRLKPISAAINAGTVDPVYQTFQTMYGINIALDFDGRIRPVNGVWDIGAFEYAATNTPPTCVGDLNGDHVVDINDLNILLSHFGKLNETPDHGDFDGNGAIDVNDLSLLLSKFGKPCP